ncbi:MAG: glycosyltransferase [Pseudohongiella sp.]|uniref:glycosyltransferase n=1 Tax=Pseudohongiella sp. TaxID=1979412 RepID=UPI0034A03B06
MNASAPLTLQSCFSRIAKPGEDQATARAILRLTEGWSELRSETRLWQAIHAMQAGRPWEAWSYLVSSEMAATLRRGTLPELPPLLAAVARALGEDSIARRLLALYPDPDSLAPPAPAKTPPHAPLPKTKAATSQRDNTVDIIIPVYKGYTQTLDCIHSVLASQADLRTRTEIVVINDASPEPELVAALRELASQQQITLIEQSQNLGFIRTMNRAMALHPQRDVVWLNADTRVCGNWLDRLRQLAKKHPDIATVSPLSNFGELMSFPHASRQGSMPDAQAQQQLDTLASQAWNGDIPELGAACGFCLYMRRAAINNVGLLDETDLLSGYGEDTDWSQRALALGWRLAGAPNVFVAHHGSVSFGSQKRQLVARNNALLKKRYPRAQQDNRTDQQRDPLASHRQRLQRHRLQQQPPVAGELLILGPASWNHPAFAHCRLDPYDADGNWIQTHAMDEQPWLRWQPTGDSRQPQACKMSLSLPGAGAGAGAGARESLPIYLEYHLPEDLALLEADLTGLPDLSWAFYELARCPLVLLQLCLRLQRQVRLMPLDDGLLSAVASPDTVRGGLLLSLAQQAAAVVVPYPSLEDRYRRVIPQARINVQPAPPVASPTPSPAPSPASPTQPTRSVLIADDLSNPALARQWQALARALHDDDGAANDDKNTEPAIKLLVLEHYPCNRSLRALGNLIEIAPIAGVGLPQSLQLCHCTVALSLDADPGAGWQAPGLARHLGLPLLAPACALARDAGARTYATMAELSHQVFNNNLSTKALTMTEKRTAKTPGKPVLKPPLKRPSKQAPKSASDTPAKQVWHGAAKQKVFLNLGCGTSNRQGLPAMFQDEQWHQVRIDIDPDTQPDIVSSNTDLSMIPDAQIDAVWSSHSLEHLDFHDVPVALKEMQRVLKPDGFALITLPDLQAIAELVVVGRLTDVVYQSAVGPIRTIDMLFGHGPSLAAGKRYMAHRCGFDAKLLGQSLLDAGFNEVRVRKGRSWDLWAYAFNGDIPPGLLELEV